MRCLALASYDSFLNVAGLIAPYFEKAGCTVDYAMVKARRGRQITASQLDTLGTGGAVRWVTIDDLVGGGSISDYDIVLSCLEGLSTRRLVHHVQALDKRPLIISAYPGLVLRYANDGFSMRTGSDLLWLNSKVDFDAYRSMCEGFGLPFDNGRVFGVASLLQQPQRRAGAEGGPVVFFEQAVIPRHREERLFLCEQLLLLARKYPQYPFRIKPRTVGAQATLHRAWHPIEPLLKEAAANIGGWPSNLQITTDKASELLETASHCLTISSTVAVEAINAGIPTAIIGDFGAHEENGLQYFFESGLIRTFDQLEFPFAKRPNAEWRDRFLTDPRETIEERVAEAVRLAGGERRKLSPELQRAEMSPQLRARLYESNGVENTLARQHQPASAFWHRVNLAAAYDLAQSVFQKWRRKR